jgi:hypothetical protein
MADRFADLDGWWLMEARPEPSASQPSAISRSALPLREGAPCNHDWAALAFGMEAGIAMPPHATTPL